MDRFRFIAFLLCLYCVFTGFLLYFTAFGGGVPVYCLKIARSGQVPVYCVFIVFVLLFSGFLLYFTAFWGRLRLTAFFMVFLFCRYCVFDQHPAGSGVL